MCVGVLLLLAPVVSDTQHGDNTRTSSLKYVSYIFYDILEFL